MCSSTARTILIGVLALLAFSVIIDASPIEIQPFIANGQRTTANNVPWQISVQVGGYHLLGGTLIRPNIVLTAADRIKKNGIDAKYVAVAGSNYANTTDGVSIAVKEIILHPDFKSSSQNDIAILKLESSFTKTSKIQPITLAKKGDRIVNNYCVISGFGSTMDTNKGSPTVLRRADATIVPPSTCKDKYTDNSNVQVNEKTLCAGGEGTTICSGDEGGPLACQNQNYETVLFGVASTTMKCGDGNPSVFTSVPAYLDWISKTNSASKFGQSLFVLLVIQLVLYMM